VRTFVRLVALALIALFAVMFLGPLAPEGTFFNDLADGFARALRIRWVGPFA
jgi:hypothetical protein